VEKTLVLIKPDAVQRGLVGEIISRLEHRGLKIVAGKYLTVSKELAEKHYAAHIGKPFYLGLVEYISSSPLMALVVEGPEAIKAVRQTMGKTNPLEAEPGTIRHDFALITSKNLTHASDSPESAAQEIRLWFDDQEIFEWHRDSDPWFFKKN
jgi:nucleoside-diphosphate kinase